MRERLAFVLMLTSILGLATPVGAAESYMEVTTAVPNRANSEISTAEARDAIDALSEKLHACYWARENPHVGPARGRSVAESRWSLVSKSGDVRASRVNIGAEGEVEEPAVLSCFRRELQKAALDDGRVIVVMRFKPLSREIREVKVLDVKPIKPAKLDQAYLDRVREHMSVDRTLRCVGPSKGEGETAAVVKVNALATYGMASTAEYASLSCNLGVEKRGFPVHPEFEEVELSVKVDISGPKARRPFESTRTLRASRASSIPDGELRFETRFGDAEVWTSEGMTSTNYLRSVCRALPSEPAKTRMQTACAAAPCVCSTEHVGDDWGELCQPYIDAGRPDRRAFFEQMFADVLSRHRSALEACGERCAGARRALEIDCSDWLSGGSE